MFNPGVALTPGGLAIGKGVAGLFGKKEWERDPAADPYGGMPQIPNYHPAFDMGTMGTAAGMESRLGGINMDPRGMQAYRTEALRTGPSAWANLATEREGLNELGARGRALRTGVARRGEALDELASRGGLRGGDEARLLARSNRDIMDMGQDIGRQAQENRLQIGINDEQNRLNQLGQLPGMEIQALQPELQKAGMYQGARMFDVGQQVAEGTAKNAFDMNKYGIQGGIWGAQKQAEAAVGDDEDALMRLRGYRQR